MAEAANPCLPYSEFSRHFWGAKFLNGYEAFDLSKNPMTLGIEVEFVAPMKVRNRKTEEIDFIDDSYSVVTSIEERKEREAQRRGQVRKGLAEIIQRRLQAEFPNVELIETYLFSEYEYVIRYQHNGRVYDYEIKEDVTIHSSPVHIGTELTSPKLYNRRDIDLFYDILNQLKTEGKIKISYTAGTHVHVGFPEAYPHEVALALSLFSAFEQQIYEAFSVLPERRRKYAGFIGDGALNFLRETDSNDFTIKDILDRFPSKNYGLNPESLKRFETLEFRLFNSSLKIEQIDQMINFAQAFIRAIREKDPKLVKLLSENRKLEELPFEQLAEAIGMDIPSVPSAVPKRASATR